MEATHAVVHVAALQQLSACMTWQAELRSASVASLDVLLSTLLERTFKFNAVSCIAWLDSNTKRSFPTTPSYACCQWLTLAKNCDFLFESRAEFLLCKSTVPANCSKKSNVIFCWLQFLNTTCHRVTLIEDSKYVCHTAPASVWFQALLRKLLDSLEETKNKVTGLLCQLCKLSLCCTWNFAWRFIV